MSDGPPSDLDDVSVDDYGDLDNCEPESDFAGAHATGGSEDDEPAASHWHSTGYDRAIVDSVWQFAEIVPGNDAALWRKDEFGAWINHDDYGKRHSSFGWEICDVAGARGTSGLSALRPMQWQNYLDQVAAMTQSRMTAEGRQNVRKLL